jgi:hypothetical protein
MSTDVYKNVQNAFGQRVYFFLIELSMAVEFGGSVPAHRSPPSVCVCVCVCVCVFVCFFLCADVPDVKENECVAGRIDSYQLKCSEKILLTWLGESH